MLDIICKAVRERRSATRLQKGMVREKKAKSRKINPEMLSVPRKSLSTSDSQHIVPLSPSKSYSFSSSQYFTNQMCILNSANFIIPTQIDGSLNIN